MSLVHVKDSAMQDRPLCGMDPGTGVAWTTRQGARKIGTCAECLREVLQDECGVCHGDGDNGDSYDPMPCPACDLDAAYELIEGRAAPAPAPESKERS